jgi:hypothetical protein
MRFLKNGVLVCVCLLICLAGFLASRSFLSEGTSLKTCALLSGPFLIWLFYQKVCQLVESEIKSRHVQ